MQNKITAVGIVKDMLDVELADVAIEICEWQQTGVTDGIYIDMLCHNLMKQAGVSVIDSTQIAEGLVLNEVCRRWIALQPMPVLNKKVELEFLLESEPTPKKDARKKSNNCGM